MPPAPRLGPGLRRGGGEAGTVRWIDTPDEAAGETNVVAWLVRLDDPRLDGWLSRSPPDPSDLARVAGRGNAGERLVRRRLARLLLAVLADVPPGAVLVERTPAGGVRVAHPAGWHLSLAGRAPWCAIAVGRSPIGVDVEPVAGEPLPGDLLTAAERDGIADHPRSGRLRASLACWVAKEAHAKRFGRPLSLDPAAVDTQPAGRPGLVRSGEDWSRVAMADGPGWIAAVAVDIE